jgi:uncharacterized protein
MKSSPSKPLTWSARAILLANERLSARDTLHVAIMERHSVPRIMSFDAGFDGLVGIEMQRAQP